MYQLYILFICTRKRTSQLRRRRHQHRRIILVRRVVLFLDHNVTLIGMHLCLVRLQSTRGIELFATRAVVRLFLGMDSDMSLQGARCRELLPARLAFEWAFARMYPHMHLAVARRCKLTITNLLK